MVVEELEGGWGGGGAGWWRCAFATAGVGRRGAVGAGVDLQPSILGSEMTTASKAHSRVRLYEAFVTCSLFEAPVEAKRMDFASITITSSAFAFSLFGADSVFSFALCVIFFFIHVLPPAFVPPTAMLLGQNLRREIVGPNQLCRF